MKKTIFNALKRGDVIDEDMVLWVKEMPGSGVGMYMRPPSRTVVFRSGRVFYGDDWTNVALEIEGELL